VTRRVSQPARDAVVIMYAKFAPAVRARARMLLAHDAHAVEDAAQETFVAASLQYDCDLTAGKKPNLMGLTDQRQLAWLRNVVKYKSIDGLRKAVRERPTDDIGRDIPADTSLDPHTRSENDWSAGQLWRKLSTCLTPMEYRVAALTFELQQPDSVIADILNIAESTVRCHRSRAVNKIKNFDQEILFPDDNSAGNRGTGAQE
jgi:RNA polymerase sigma factor (sigma-70 family)